MRKNRRFSVLPLASLLLAACGGGGGGGGGSANPPGDTLAAPTGLTATGVVGGILLAWNPVPGADAYALWMGEAPGFPLNQTTFLGTADAPPVVVPGSPEFGLVYYKVTTLAGELSSGPSNEASFDFGGGGPGPDPFGPDPLFGEQWHLANTGQQGGTPGEDARVVAAWSTGVSGQGVDIAIVDDGLEIGHVDLAPKVIPNLSFDYVELDKDPTGGEHGTSVAGVSAAARDNGRGGAGVAYFSRLAGFNFLQNSTLANEVDAMLRGLDVIDVSNNSWGPPSQGIPVPSTPTWRGAIEQGLAQGREGLGLCYVFAAGNGGIASAQNPVPMEDANLLGYQNYHGVFAVAAVGDDGKQASYSNPGACVLVAAPSMGRADHGITTADRSGFEGYNQGTDPGNYADLDFTDDFSGTSSAAPLVSGVIALLLDRRPDLTWRDVRLILARSARRNHPTDADWRQNGAGRWVNHKYGFGVVDAVAARNMAENFVSVGGSATLKQIDLASPPLNVAIPDGNPAWILRTLNVSSSLIQSIESVEVGVRIEHPWIGDLEVELISPQGTVSVLSRVHYQPDYGPGFQDWTFSTLRCLDESPNGTWTLRVRDTQTPDGGTLKGWSLRVRGR